MKNRLLSGFTLTELLVVISIIGILVVGATKLDWNTLSNKQKISIFTNKLVSSIETVRNNSLIGRSVRSNGNLIVPKKWKVEFSTSGSGRILTSYDLDGTNDWTPYLDFSPDKFYSIKSLECLNLFSTSNEVLSGTGTGTIIIELSKLSLTGSLTGCSDDSSKKLKLTSDYKSFTESFSINVVNGLIER